MKHNFICHEFCKNSASTKEKSRLCKTNNFQRSRNKTRMHEKQTCISNETKGNIMIIVGTRILVSIEQKVFVYRTNHDYLRSKNLATMEQITTTRGTKVYIRGINHNYKENKNLATSEQIMTIRE
jgi:hypothetical protein